MKINFIWLGKCKNKSFHSVIKEYEKRLKHYSNVSISEIRESNKKFSNREDQMKNEADLLLSKLSDATYVVLLDERGKHLTSRELAKWVQHKMNISIGKIAFIICGAYGAHPTIANRADFTLALSHMTLTHDMCRILLLEQVYRAHTILKGEKYHND